VQDLSPVNFASIFFRNLTSRDLAAIEIWAYPLSEDACAHLSVPWRLRDRWYENINLNTGKGYIPLP